MKDSISVSYMDFFKHSIIKVDDLIPYELSSRTQSNEQVAQVTNPALCEISLLNLEHY